MLKKEKILFADLAAIAAASGVLSIPVILLLTISFPAINIGNKGNEKLLIAIFTAFASSIFGLVWYYFRKKFRKYFLDRHLDIEKENQLEGQANRLGNIVFFSLITITIIGACSFQLASKIEENSSYKKVINGGDLVAAEKFLDKYPDSSHQEEISGMVRQLKRSRTVEGVPLMITLLDGQTQEVITAATISYRGQVEKFSFKSLNAKEISRVHYKNLDVPGFIEGRRDGIVSIVIVRPLKY